MSQEEFVSFYNNFLPAPPKRENVLTGLPPVNGTDLVDWTGTLTTPVKDQAQCGSCWAFSATEQFESDIMRVTGTTLVLSPQQIVSCSKVNAGCNGGNTETAYSYVKRFGGQELESDYPYTSQRGVSGSCSSDAKKAAATMTGYTTVDGEVSGVEWSGVEWSGVEWSGVERKLEDVLRCGSLRSRFWPNSPD